MTVRFYGLGRPQRLLRDPSVVIAISCLVILACLISLRHGDAIHAGWDSNWITRLDMTVEQYFSRAAQQRPRLDLVISLLSQHNLLKGAPIIFLGWAAFFHKQPRNGSLDECRSKLIGVIPLAIAGLVLGRALALILPFRARPVQISALHYPLLPGTAEIYHWSSFPSDHAILFIGLALGIFSAARREGLVALAYVLFFILGPRLYLGIHWPTDILVGATLGAIIAATASIPAYRRFVWERARRAWDLYPGICAASMFLLSYEITDLFDTPITIASMLVKHTRL